MLRVVLHYTLKSLVHERSTNLGSSAFPGTFSFAGESAESVARRHGEERWTRVGGRREAGENDQRAAHSWRLPRRSVGRDRRTPQTWVKGGNLKP